MPLLRTRIPLEASHRSSSMHVMLRKNVRLHPKRKSKEKGGTGLGIDSRRTLDNRRTLTRPHETFSVVRPAKRTLKLQGSVVGVRHSPNSSFVEVFGEGC